MESYRLVSVGRILAQQALVLGLLAFGVSCAGLQSVPVGGAELTGLVAGIAPMGKKDAAALLQEKALVLRDEDEGHSETNTVTSAAFTKVGIDDDPISDPLLGLIVFGHHLTRTTRVLAWRDATGVWLQRLLGGGDRPCVWISVTFSRSRERAESSSGGPFKVDFDRPGAAMSLVLAWVSDGEGYAFPGGAPALPHTDLVPILSAIKALTGLAPGAAAAPDAEHSSTTLPH